MAPRIEPVRIPDDEFATGPAGPAWAALSRWLDERDFALREEVRGYPTPIARCDVQLTKLLEQRGAVIATLRRMRASEVDVVIFPTHAAVRAVLADGPATDDPAEARLRDRLRASLHSMACLD